MEVCLDEVFGRGYRKFESAIPAGFGDWEALGWPRKTPKGSWREASGRGRGGIRCYQGFSSSKRVAPVLGGHLWARTLGSHLSARTCRRRWDAAHLWRSLDYRSCSHRPIGPEGRPGMYSSIVHSSRHGQRRPAGRWPAPGCHWGCRSATGSRRRTGSLPGIRSGWCPSWPPASSGTGCRA